MGGATPSGPKPAGWRECFAEWVRRGRRIQHRDAGEAVRVWLEGWRELNSRLPDRVDTIDDAQAHLGQQPFIQNWVWDLVDTWRPYAASKKQSAVDAVGFLEEFLGRFEGESGNFRRAMEAELAHFLMSAGRVEAAVEICERLIEEFPAEARGYCVLADIYLAEEPPDLERALEVLKAAGDYPVEDARDWDLAARTAYVRRELRLSEASELGDRID